MEKAMDVGLSQFEDDMYFDCLEIDKQWKDKSEQEAIFAIMGEQVKIASQLIGLLEDSVISDITGVSINHIQNMKN